jgi:hypothetical protein
MPTQTLDPLGRPSPERRRGDRRRGHADQPSAPAASGGPRGQAATDARPTAAAKEGEHAGHAGHGSYARFAAMVATSTVLGWAAMYLNTAELDHVFFSWTRVFMAMIMGGIMTAVMLLFMRSMYPDRRLNRAVLGVAAMLVVGGLALARSQATVDDVAYMRAMIPHHSIAILTSTRADITDPRVRRLADDITQAQRREIAEMKQLVDELSQRRP